MNLKNQLARLLKVNNLKINELAQKTGIAKSTIGDWLNGTNPSNISQVKIIADYFGVSIDWLCFGEEIEARELNEYSDEINAGVFEVVLRRVKK